MKKTKFSLVLAIISISLLAFGCYATQQPYNLDTPSGGGGPVATATPVVAALFATVAISNNTGVAVVVATLQQGSGGAGIAGGTITINGTILSDMGGGGYSGMIMGLAAGNTITVTITSSGGSASGSDVMPASGGTTSTTAITGADAGSTLTLLNA
jgi:hypothetical protein